MSQKRRILIIDDEASFTRLLKAALEHRGGYEVAQANSAAEGLTAARTFCPDVILLDVIMPDRSGTEVAAALQADQRLKAIPIIFLTAAVPTAAEARAGALSGSPVLAKPVSLEELMACIEKQLAGGSSGAVRLG